MKIVSIDNDKFYGKELPEQDIVILFKRPKGSNDEECESFCKDIFDIVKAGGDKLSSSDIVNQTKWNNDNLETIGEFLYVHSGERVIISKDLSCVYSRNYDELYEGDQRIALIQTIQPNNNYWKYVSVAISVLCLFLIIRCVSNHLEENRVNANQELYSNDLNTIETLRNEYQKAISEGHSYAHYISGSDKSIISNKLDSLLEAANSNIDKACESGDYSPVISDANTYESAIAQLIENAKSAEKVSLENARVEKNRKKYEKDVQIIESLSEVLSNTISNQPYSSYLSDSQVQNIKDVLDSLRKVLEASFNAVEHSGYYNNLSIDSEGIRTQIQAVVESAQEEYERNNKQRTVVTPVRFHRRISSSSPKRNEENRYDNLVKLADKDYNNYYLTRDVEAARRAINNYNKALKIKDNSNITNRCNRLKKDLGL